ncbi:hypothetical protein SAMN05428944_7617 [Streptomyces sp. 1222.5]|nr:hypothetical protein BX260_0470 [Streptomyces sp. 5112.2]SED41993.1 hypothetical protein SAMN05428944_7617 [Streptomyces sp. 1222.5]
MRLHNGPVTGGDEQAQILRYDRGAEEDDGRQRSRRGPILLTTLAVPAVGAAGVQAGSLRAGQGGNGILHMVVIVALLLIAFVVVALGIIWAINTVASLIGGIAAGWRRTRRDVTR